VPVLNTYIKTVDKHKKTTYIFFILTLLLAIIINPLSSESMGVPQMGKKEEGSFATYYKEGGKRWEGKWTMEKYEEEGETKVRIVMNARGLTSPFSKDMEWEAVSVWKEAEGKFVPVEAETVFKDTGGNVKMTENVTVDESGGGVLFTRKDHDGGESTTETFEAPPELLVVDGMVVALRALPFASGDTFETEFLSNEPEMYDVEFKQKGIEVIKTPEGEIECYKVELVPKLGVLNVFKVFFPKTYFWFTKAPPHRWVRYEGLEKGRDTPHVIMEVTRFKEPGKNTQ
jgi:hypothetical protein